MRKKFLLMVLSISFLMCGCGTKEIEIKNEQVLKNEDVDSSSNASTDVDYSVFEGNYDDKYSQRATAEVTVNGDADSVLIKVWWGSSAMETTFWEMNATFDGEHLNYNDCTKTDISFNDEGEDKEEVKYTDGAGYFEWDDGLLKWIGASEESCKDCVFERFSMDSDDVNVISVTPGITKEEFESFSATCEVTDNNGFDDFDFLLSQDYLGTWFDPEMGEAFKLTPAGAYVYIPYLDMYGDELYEWEIIDRSDRGLCPELAIYNNGPDCGPLAYYIAGYRDGYFFGNIQGFIFYKQN